MRRHFILVVVAMLITVSLFTAWFVRVLDTLLIQQNSSQVLDFTGQVEFSPTLSDWSEVRLDQIILPNTSIRTAEESTLTIWLDSVSRLVLQPNTQVRYLGFKNGTSTWEVIMGTVNGRYNHPSHPDRSLSLLLNQSTVTITRATFQVKNELTNKSITAYDQPLFVGESTSLESDQAIAITVQPGETYVLSESDSTVLAAEPIDLIPTENTPPLTATESATDTINQTELTQGQAVLMPDSLQNFAFPPLTSSINLTIGTTEPLTFIWVESNPPATNQKYRIFRSESTPLDDKTANGYRTVTGTQQMSYVWPLPSKAKTYHLRVCRLNNDQCEIWSNTITIPAGTFQ